MAAVWAAGAWGAPPEKFGHRFYAEAPAAALVPVGPSSDGNRTVRLRAPAARAYAEMSEAARAEGVRLAPLSGFRSVSYQNTLFARAVKRYGSERKAAGWVAPPGYSEHATGWVLDLGDGSRRSTDVKPEFRSTPAYRWLSAHAARFGFELSFPFGNPQGVQFEPWHWRYVGTGDARAVFHPDPPANP